MLVKNPKTIRITAKASSGVFVRGQSMECGRVFRIGDGIHGSWTGPKPNNLAVLVPFAVLQGQDLTPYPH